MLHLKTLNDANSTLRDGIKRAASAGIIQGRGDGYFDPNTPITREESAIIVNKALQYKGIWGTSCKPTILRQRPNYL